MGQKISVLLMILIWSMSMSVFAVDQASQSEAPVLVAEESEAEQAVRLRKEDVIFLQIGNYATVSNGTLTWIDRQNQAVKPFIKDSRTVVPLRFITEEMGATVTYDNLTRGITIELGDTVMQLTVGEKSYSLNGTQYEMDCAAQVLEGRTFVPVRFVSVALGRSVEWLNDERIVVVTPADRTWVVDGEVELAALAEVRLSLSPLGRNKIN